MDILTLLALFAVSVFVAAKWEKIADFFVRVAGTMACGWAIVQIVRLLLAK